MAPQSWIFAAIFTLFVPFASAGPIPEVRVVTYGVDALTLTNLKKQMKDRGPNGFWAYTRWYVKWTRTCEVSLTIDYTYPQHIRSEALHPAVRKAWFDMMAALKAHEEQHGAHGIAAARDIVQADCKKARRIIQKWAAEDRRYDRRTRHGKTEGVILQ